jgi:hypothetical protein
MSQHEAADVLVQSLDQFREDVRSCGILSHAEILPERGYDGNRERIVRLRHEPWQTMIRKGGHSFVCQYLARRISVDISGVVPSEQSR